MFKTIIMLAGCAMAFALGVMVGMDRGYEDRQAAAVALAMQPTSLALAREWMDAKYIEMDGNYCALYPFPKGQYKQVLVTYDPVKDELTFEPVAAHQGRVD